MCFFICFLLIFSSLFFWDISAIYNAMDRFPSKTKNKKDTFKHSLLPVTKPANPIKVSILQTFPQ